MVFVVATFLWLAAGVLTTRLGVYYDGTPLSTWKTRELIGCTVFWPVILLVMGIIYTIDHWPFRHASGLSKAIRRLYGK